MRLIAGVLAYATTASFVRAATAADDVFAPKMTQNTPRATYIGNLVNAARPIPNSYSDGNRRHLEDVNDIDLASYSIKFEKCQYVKQYAEQQNNNNNNNKYDTVLEKKTFVIFRLCPENASSSSGSSSSSSSSCSSCDSNYGEYIIDMDSYLQITVQHKQEEQEQYCEACNECAANNDDQVQGDDAAAADDAAAGRRRLHLRNAVRHLTSVDCDTCYSTCQNIENMETNGYVDASEYVQCAKVYENENKNIVYYAGAVCTNYGTRIKVGLFTDENCNNYDSNAAVDQYIKNQNGYNVKLSYHLLKQTFASDACVASCASASAEDDDNANNAAGTAEVCQNLYEASGKCESPSGFKSGMSTSSNYKVQLNNEDVVCDYITNIYAGHYDESGEVTTSTGTLTIFGGRRTVKNTTTRISGGQKFALSFFIIGTVGLVSYALLLRRKLARANKEPLFT